MQAGSLHPSAVCIHPKRPGTIALRLSLNWRWRIDGESKAAYSAAVACASVIDPSGTSYGLQMKIGVTEQTLCPAKPATAAAPTEKALPETLLRKDAGKIVDTVCGVTVTETYFESA